jgi:hypothetical protein
MNNAALMLRQATKIIARRFPAISRLVKQRDELLIEVGGLRDQLGRESAAFDLGIPQTLARYEQLGPGPRPAG